MKDLLIIDLAIFLPFIFMYFFPPKELNAIYGYRTKRSSKDQKSWDFAQKYSAKRFIYILIFIAFSQVMMILSGVDINQDASFIIGVTLSIFIIGAVACVISTEIALKKLQENA
ncbi:SdpI family protein [Ornithobacterium rhinotracheale]|uniref:SdpI family protein n=1 Tax=Ornithobacterium rhinotracheale TaxID=28251 RepID=UPI001FF50725|nr:SdpI family protein [Ornithobacterium rhinotracheale]MCK0205205.1 SdpI family protein [Ornithobacterium rhinotracheale]